MVSINQVFFIGRKLWQLYKKYKRNKQRKQQHAGGAGGGYPSSGHQFHAAPAAAGGAAGGVAVDSAGVAAGPWQDTGGKQNQDTINSNNDYFQNLRNTAVQMQEHASQKFSESQRAYKSGDGARAHELSEEGKRLNAQRDQLNEQAADWIFSQNNKNRGPGEVDLHGLKVTEAELFAKQSIARARNSGLSELRLIVGKGNHSSHNVAKVRPAIEQYLKEHSLDAYLEPHNAGVLVVLLQGQKATKGRSLGQAKHDECVIM